jgi:hypothetical protein
LFLVACAEYSLTPANECDSFADGEYDLLGARVVLDVLVEFV